MATADEYFTHLLQAYGSFKGDPQHRRQVADRIVEFVGEESAVVSFEPPALPEIEVHDIAPVEKKGVDVQEEMSLD